MRAVHPLAPVSRWGQLDEHHRLLAVDVGWKRLREAEAGDGWWELGRGMTLVRWKPPGHRKPWVCMSVLCRELSELEQGRVRPRRADWATE